MVSDELVKRRAKPMSHDSVNSAYPVWSELAKRGGYFPVVEYPGSVTHTIMLSKSTYEHVLSAKTMKWNLVKSKPSEYDSYPQGTIMLSTYTAKPGESVKSNSINIRYQESCSNSLLFLTLSV